MIPLITLATPHIGESYILGSRASLDPAFRGPWDCAEWCTWLAYQLTGKLYGAGPNGDAWTGFWRRDLMAGVVNRIAIDQAIATPGSFLLRYPAQGAVGHIVPVVDGGHTIEAMDHKHGVVRSDARGRRWDAGILVPGIITGPVATLETVHPPALLRQGDQGPSVVALQKALGVAADGKFGRATLAAVVAFQRAQGLVVDGEAGHATWSALEAR